ncbi:o-succinylbenzoate synthase [Marinilongibacter aquaticus]|uniref:o-succinylbenzoate synthase n=1 Tax=Marinilongibacter aquaticus TaxID=2975157 RepID=UPI0021BD7A17|nr:o-succinylbenzoate synthase [Marinilongibacter aquaticus]UBM59607.1 o-succinylbenzoate synthase [Marinilongibacter aquaticus]
MIKAEYCKHTLKFKFDAGTSRGILKTHEAFIFKLWDDSQAEIVGLGEAAPLKGLSPEFGPDFENRIQKVVNELNRAVLDFDSLKTILFEKESPYPASIQFALETALLDLENGGQRKIYENDFSAGTDSIPINGLIWMGNETFMAEQIEKKLRAGFKTIKMKIGAIDFDTEFKLLKSIRARFPASELTLRVDANGAFDFQKAQEVLTQLAELEIHSIEQPIRTKQYDEMAQLCAHTPVPIALDEELIGLKKEERESVLQQIKPQFLIFKPTLLGGLRATAEWIALAENMQIGWWITSALESNIGLNAIAQFTYAQRNPMPQGLGTGQLYHNNFDSPLTIDNGHIHYIQSKKWNLDLLT